MRSAARVAEVAPTIGLSSLRGIFVDALGVAWYDVVGMGGVGLILLAYALLQAGRVNGDSLKYQLLNLIGALAVLVSLKYEFNLSAVLMEIAWVLVSLYGIARGMRARSAARVA